MILALLLAAATGSLDAPSSWTQMRLAGSNNAVVRGSLQTTWTLKTKGPFSSSPAIAGNTLYVGNNAGELFAIDIPSGKVIWSIRVPNPLMASPIVTGDLVIAGEGNEASTAESTPSHPTIVGSPPSALIAYNRLTGAQVWRSDLQGSGMPMPALIDGILVQHNGGGYLDAFNPLTGARIYARNVHSFASMNQALPLGRGLFASSGVSQNAVFVFRVRDGSTVWQTNLSPIAAGVGDCPAVTDGARLYCDYVMPPSSAIPVQTERHGFFRAYAMDLATGKRVWDVQLDVGVVPKRNESAIPLALGGTVFMGSSISHDVHAIDTSNGSVRWRMHAHGAVKGGIVEYDNVLYFGDYAGYLWAVNASNGSVAGSRYMGAKFNVGSPVLAGQTLIIGAMDGELFAIPLAQIRSSRGR